MKTRLLMVLLLFGGVAVAWGQVNDADTTETASSKKMLKILNEKFVSEKKNLEELIVAFRKQTSEISVGNLDVFTTSLKVQKEKIDIAAKAVGNLKDSILVYKDYYVYTSVLKKDKADELVKDVLAYTKDATLEKEAVEKVSEAKVYAYFDENTVFADEELFNKGTPQHKVMQSVLKQNVKTYFGDIIIPKDGQTLYFYDNNDKLLSDRPYHFKKIAVQVKEGVFSDIKVYIEYKGKTHIFENIVGVSMLRYSSLANKNYLFYRQTVMGLDKFVSLDDMRKLRIKLGDVMVHDYKVGNNYIPADLTIELPQNDINGNPTNVNAPAQYQIKQDTKLDKIVELRAYSDFLALFGNTSNGLVQVEGKAKFYAFTHPFQVCSTKGQIEFLSSFSPYVNYSRFDDDNRYVPHNKIQNSAPVRDTVAMALDLVQRRFLTMGMEANLVKLKHKDFPIEANLYGVAAYQLSQINLGNDSIPKINDIKALSYGGGINLSAKRFNHFGFDYKLEFLWFDYHNFNTIPSFRLPQNGLPVIKNEAEVYYKPGASSDAAIFLRLLTFNNLSDKNNEAFYQFQFGYKFSIGNRAIK